MQIYKTNQGVDRGTDPPLLDTLAQLPPNSPPLLKSRTPKDLLKRARSKWYTQQIVYSLVDLNSPLKKYYWNAYHCSSVIKQVGKELTSKYCNTRACNVCNRIRTAKLMNGYISQLVGRHLDFVTLTVPNCPAEELPDVICKMIKDFTLINRKLREKKSIEINGIRKIEVTYNSAKNTYHPHIHLLVDNGSQLIVDQWLERNTEAKRIAQDIRQADEKSLPELFKYTTKIIGHKAGEIVVYATALDVILRALTKIRTYQPFGDIRKVSEDVDNVNAQEYEDLPEMPIAKWQWEECDWVVKDKKRIKQTLTGYIPPDIQFHFLYTSDA
jgi:hypothetical protein